MQVFRYRLDPTCRQVANLERLLRFQRELYNFALRERCEAWEQERRPVRYVDQCRLLAQMRTARPELREFGVCVSRGSLRWVDGAFRNFYARCQRGEAPGFPRFKSETRFDSMQWADASGWKLEYDAGRLRLLGIGSVKIRLHRALRGTPKGVTVTRKGRHWYACIRCVNVEPNILPKTGADVGIDLGVVNIIATSDGHLEAGPRFGRRAAANLAAAQQNLDLKQPGSNRRRRAVERVGTCHRRVHLQRKDLSHKLSRKLVDAYDLIVIEDLKISSMVRARQARPKPKGTIEKGVGYSKTSLNRSIQDAGWGVLAGMLVYKAADAGRELRVVSPRFTSQRCAICGHTDAASRRTQAVFKCLACGYEAHADLNAACNILWAGRAQRASARAG